jgi:hypothetical protein
MQRLIISVLAFVCGTIIAADAPIQISGIYPGLAAFNPHGECGIGAVVPWAGRLWWLTYPPHEPKGSQDKLYSVGPDMKDFTVHRESVGGTHAGRMIHEASKQLIMGPYFIDEKGKIRVADIKTKLIGRLTAVAQHLTDPDNMVYFYDMEGAVYEVNVHTLEVKKLFSKPVPGWHGKGGYTAQKHFVISNNGELQAGAPPKELKAKLPPKTDEDAGVLAEWDGKEWRIIERHQFTEVTGPGGINGSPNGNAPLWAMGWDKRSVILKLRDSDRPPGARYDSRKENSPLDDWHTFRLPKGSYSFDPKHGWFTEWPRIREVTDDKFLAIMHGQMFDFPRSFGMHNTSGIRPLCTHLRYIPDLAVWNNKIVLAADDASAMKTPLVGQSQSNLWFGTWDDLTRFGPQAAWGGVWAGDKVKAGVASDPFLIAGYAKGTLHLVNESATGVTFSLEIDDTGSSHWADLERIEVPAKSYRHHVFDHEVKCEWVRLKVDKDCTATAYFHLGSVRDVPVALTAETRAGLTPVTHTKQEPWGAAWIRPAKANRNLQVFSSQADGQDGTDGEAYHELNELMEFSAVSSKGEADEFHAKLKPVTPEFTLDAASVIVTDAKKNRWRLPRTDAEYDKPFGAFGWPRGLREVQSERYMANFHGIFYEVPRTAGQNDSLQPDYQRMKPVTTHHSRIMDYCSWRGMLVMSGCDYESKGAHFFRSKNMVTALWCGMVDDLWKLGKPIGHGGPWLDTKVKSGEASDAYLMTNFDKKCVHLQHDQKGDVKFTIEVDFLCNGIWHKYADLTVPAGQGTEHVFPTGYAAHWVRVVPAKDCTATAQFVYE